MTRAPAPAASRRATASGSSARASAGCSPRGRCTAPSWAIAFLGRGRPQWTITEQQALARVWAIQQGIGGRRSGE
jgi:hypothetical protein